LVSFEGAGKVRDEIRAGDVAVRLAVSISRVQARMRREGGSLDRGITASQLAMMQRLAKGTGLSISALAATEHVSQQAITQRLDLLRPTGYVSMAPDPADGRKKLVSLTETGEKYLEDAAANEERWLARALRSSMSERELAVLLEAADLLDRIEAAESDEEAL